MFCAPSQRKFGWTDRFNNRLKTKLELQLRHFSVSVLKLDCKWISIGTFSHLLRHRSASRCYTGQLYNFFVYDDLLQHLHLTSNSFSVLSKKLLKLALSASKKNVSNSCSPCDLQVSRSFYISNSFWFQHKKLCSWKNCQKLWIGRNRKSNTSELWGYIVFQKLFQVLTQKFKLSQINVHALTGLQSESLELFGKVYQHWCRYAFEVISKRTALLAAIVFAVVGQDDDVATVQTPHKKRPICLTPVCWPFLATYHYFQKKTSRWRFSSHTTKFCLSQKMWRAAKIGLCLANSEVSPNSSKKVEKFTSINGNSRG